MKIHYEYLLSAALAALLLLPGCKDKETARPEKSVRVSTQKLTPMLFQHRIPIKGTVLPIRYASISAKTEGTLDDLYVDEGNHVKKGGKLFTIDRVKLENAVTVKQEEVTVAETELATARIEYQLAQTREEKAKFDLNRGKTLIRSKAMAATNYEEAVVTEKAAAALVKKSRVAVDYRSAKLVQARTNLKIAQKDLHDATVTAPFDCLVTETFQEQGEYVKTGAVILKIENVRDLEIIAYLSANYHPLIQVGKTPAAVSFEGKKCGTFPITYCAETIDPVTRTFKIKIELPAGTILRSGMLCDLDVILAESRGLGVPEEAILQRGDDFFVYTATPEKRAKACPVRKGITDRGFTEILTPGELKNAAVIVSGQRFVNANDRLSIAE